MKRRIKKIEYQRVNCKHLDKFCETEYGYIPGECVMQPEYDFCSACGFIFGSGGNHYKRIALKYAA